MNNDKQVIDDLASIVGKENASDEIYERMSYGQDTSGPDLEPDNIPAFVVRPISADPFSRRNHRLHQAVQHCRPGPCLFRPEGCPAGNRHQANGRRFEYASENCYLSYNSRTERPGCQQQKSISNRTAKSRCCLYLQIASKMPPDGRGRHH